MVWVGRARIDALTVKAADGSVAVYPAKDAELGGTCRLEDDAWAVGGKTVTGIGTALFNRVTFRPRVPAAGSCELFVRYASPGGGRLGVVVNAGANLELNLADTESWHYYGDHMVTAELHAGENEVRIEHDLIFARWDDGTEARWDTRGFRAANGEVVFSIDGDRMWPDSWSGQPRIFLFSMGGSSREWTLPATWAGVSEAALYPLTAAGRGVAAKVPVRNRRATVCLPAGTPYVLVP